MIRFVEPNDEANREPRRGKDELKIMNGANGMRDIEGKVTRVGTSERGERTSFKYKVKAKLADSFAPAQSVASPCDQCSPIHRRPRDAA